MLDVANLNPGEAPMTDSVQRGQDVRRRPPIERLNRCMIAFFARAGAKYLRRDTRKAMRLLAVVTRFPGIEPQLHLLFAKACYRAGHVEAGRRAVNAIVAEGRRPYQLCGAADCQIHWKDLESAHDTLTAAAKRFPWSWGVFRHLGRINELMVHPDLAERWFTLAIELAHIAGPRPLHAVAC